MYPVIKPVMATGTNDIYVYLGFCPDYVEVVNYSQKVKGEWHRALGNDASLTMVPEGTDDNELVPYAESGSGVKLCRFEKPGVDRSDAPEVVTDPNEADGIIITADFGNESGSTAMNSGDTLWIYGWRAATPFVRAVHDGGSVVYLKDTDMDFMEQGVSGDQQWIAINKTQGSYAYVGDVQQPFGENRYNKVTLTDSGGNAITSTMSDNDVFWLMPKDEAQYPLSDIGHFS